ncbi:helix-turn-helix transcriptional regulator [Paenibacillus tuaregi]|uniref:helix-turn-helix transcriptional regulator n=1 Tax=Paenibacillus tuaregi TaxID=1816681 RepID=UPI00083902C2|nr:YafY family protein [Paenibacillus tuaregi]
MKLDRLLAITMTLLNQPRVSATELAERFEVSLRTIYRDMESINLAGIPVVSYPGSEGGYEILPGYRVDKQVLSLDDLSSIYSALRGARSATSDSGIDGLMDRIGAMLPGRPTEAHTASVDLDFTPTPNDRQKIGPLQQAVKQLRVVRFNYLDNRGTETERTVEPMGLFLKNYVWYLYGYCRMRSAIRVFRLSRILKLHLLEEPFTRRSFTLQDVERQFMGQADYSKVKASLQFSPEVRTRVRDEFGFDEVLENPDGSLSVTAHFFSTERAIQIILSYSYHVTLLGPPELIVEFKRHIQRLTEKYKL